MNPAGSFYYPINSVTEETVINKSRFICFLEHCKSADEAKNIVAKIATIYPDAGHHCYAFVAGNPSNSQSYGFNDDGEPGGTAGRPMLSALQGHEIGQICAVVVRYFGGIKLGTGGLQRAYGGCVRSALLKLETQLAVPHSEASLVCSYDMSSNVNHVLAGLGVEIIQQDFAGDIQMRLNIPDHHYQQLQQRLTTISSGLLQLVKID